MPWLEPLIDALATTELWGNSAQRWLIALGVLIASVGLLHVVVSLLKRRMAAWADAGAADWFAGCTQVLQRTRFWFLLIAAAYLASLALTLSPKAGRIAASVAIVALLAQAALWGSALVGFWVGRYAQRRLEIDAAGATTVSALGYLAKVAIWSVAVLLALQNLGVNVTAMLAGIGIGGVAVALAAQNLLGDLLASATIVLDKPFVLGDFIIVGSEMGTVEHIGLKTTRVRSLSGEQLVFANNDLLQSRVRNFKRMQQRRIVFTLGVVYQTPYEKVAAIPAMLREAVEAQAPVRFERAHFKQYGDFALVYEVVYHVLSPDYGLYMDIQQAINLAIHRRFEAEKIAFAYPTQTVLLRQAPETPA